MRSYKLKNLNCANCAINIETALKKMDIVKDVSISFATETLKIDTSDFDSVKRKIKDIEPDVEIEDSIKSTSKDYFLKIKRAD